MRAAALGNACGARAASVPLTVATLPLPSASASPSSIVVAVRGGVATSRAPVSAASARSNHGARRTSVVSRAVDGGSLSSVSLGPSASSSSSSSAPASGGVGGSKATVVLPLDQVDLTSEVRLGSLGVLLSERAIGERKGDCETFDSISDQRKKTCSVFPLVAAVARPPRDVLSYLLFLLNLLLKPRKKTKKCNSLSLSLSLQAGIDWTKLRDLLASGDFRAADDEHRARLIELAGPAAVERNWVYFSEVKTMPARDLRVMDALWRGASNGKYGFSAQREVWLTNRKR